MDNRLNRFKDAQPLIYDQALQEIKNGHKAGHWMWFIFPQLRGLGSSPTNHLYAIKDLDEARAYLSDPVLGRRLEECTLALLSQDNPSAEDIFGYPDVLKLCSSLTLFEQVAGENSLYSRALDKFYDGQRDPLTLNLLAQ